MTDDRITADEAYGLACQGVGMLWRSDFQNARQLLVALATRADRRLGGGLHRKGDGGKRPDRQRAADSGGGPSGGTSPGTGDSGTVPSSTSAISIDDFNRIRQARAQRARTLGMLLIELDADYQIALRRAPDLRQACLEAYGPSSGPRVVALRELLGLIGAHQWRLRGIEIPAAGGRIHPHYGVFTPTRNEYIDLVAQTPFPGAPKRPQTAFDIGTGTGVLAAVLARRGIANVVATDSDERALACARENIGRLGLTARVAIQKTHLFPDGQAELIVCNPPWVPARPGSTLERAIYDPDSAMLRGFLDGLRAHLAPEGEGWLILSDLAEHLGLRTRESLLGWIEGAGLTVAGRHDIRPRHPNAQDTEDPLHAARRREVTSLWRLKVTQA